MYRGIRRYELGERIGLGDMAEVFRADAIDGNERKRPVIIKRILPQFSADPIYQQSFRDEAKIASTLRHPNVVELLDVGRLDDVLFLAYEHVDGGDLDRVMQRLAHTRRKFPIASALFVVSEVLKALHYVHTRTNANGPLKIVHRDVCPDHVMVSRGGDVKLGDFGLAKATIRAGKTVPGVAKGHTGYVSPEQLSGLGVDPRADVYGAGMLFYTLLAGRHPLAEVSVPQRLGRILEGKIPPLSSFRADLPQDLENIVVRAIRADPVERFPSASEFQLAVLEFANANRIHFASSDLAEFVNKLFIHGETETGPTFAAGAVPSLVARDLVVVVNEDEDGRSSTRDEEGVVRESVYKSRVNYVPPRGPEEPPEPQREPRRSERPTVLRNDPLPPRRPGKGRPTAIVHKDDVSSSPFEIEPDLAPPAPKPKSPKKPKARGATRLGPIPTPAPESSRDGSTRPTALPFESRDGTTRPTPIASRDGTTRPTPIGPGLETGTVSAIGPGIDGPTKPTPLGEGPTKPTPLLDYPGEASSAEALHSPTQRMPSLLPRAPAPSPTKASTGEVDVAPDVIWLPGHKGAVGGIGLSSDGRTALSGGNDQKVMLWNLRSRKVTRTLEGHKAAVTAIVISADASIGLSGSRDKSMVVWDLASGLPLHTFDDHSAWIFSVALSADATRALSAGLDGKIKLWDVDDGAAMRTMRGHDDSVSSVVFFPDGKRALSGSRDKTLRIWDLSTGKEQRVIEGDMDSVRAVAVSPDGTRALAAGADPTIRLWDLLTGKELHRFLGHREAVAAVAFSSDGTLAVSGGYDGTLRLWDARAGKPLATLSAGGEPVLTVAFAADASFILSGGADGRVGLWRTPPVSR